MGGKRPLNLAPRGKLVVITSCVRSLPLDGIQSSEQNDFVRSSCPDPLACQPQTLIALVTTYRAVPILRARTDHVRFVV